MRIFQHVATGLHYELLCGAVHEEKSDDVLVVYRSISTGVIWVRPKTEFFDGKFKEVL